MPNTPLMQGCGVVGFASSVKLSSSEKKQINNIFGKSSLMIELKENKMDALTSLSGSGPAYVFYLAETMISAAMRFGFDKKTSALLVNRTILGAARMLEAAGKSPEELRKDVTSPAGTTAAAINCNWNGTLVNAIRRAKKRASELSL